MNKGKYYFIILPLFFVIVGCSIPEKPDSITTENEKKPKFNWDDKKTKFMWYIKHLTYFPNAVSEIKISIPNRQTGYRVPRFKITLTKDSKEIYSWDGHEESPFLFVENNLLIHTIHSPNSTGCILVAYDLKNQQEKWRCDLGVEPKIHTSYRNQIILSLDSPVFPKEVIVMGNEVAGQYFKKVNIKTGISKTVEFKYLAK